MFFGGNKKNIPHLKELKRILRITLGRLSADMGRSGLSREKAAYLSGAHEAYREILDILDGNIVIGTPVDEEKENPRE